MLCQICSNDKLTGFLDLGEQPACIFLDEKGLNAEKRFRLDAYYCDKCGLVQTGHIVDPKLLFTDNYHHIAALSQSFKDHLNALASHLTKKFKLSSRNLIVEIGSNDGALLEAFTPFGTKILGVDPSDVAAIAIKKGVATIQEFFDENLAARIVQKHGKAEIIASLNTFAHIAALDTLMKGIRLLLTDSGVFVSESHYLLDLISQLQYDFIYHEHTRYYSVKSLVFLFNKYGMDVFDVERIPTHSGSIRVYACKKNAYPISESVSSLLQEETEYGLAKIDTYKAFGKKVEEHKKAFKELLRGIRAKGETIAGLTFPARAVTLLNACQVGPDILSYISEGSNLKIGKYSPGTHIKVVDESILFSNNGPDYGLLLSWHIQNEIIPKFKAKGFKGKFIIPLPAPRIINN